jgi:gliding motility-associated lipoprotein GldD
MHIAIRNITAFLVLLILQGCNDSASVPKPDAMLALEYPAASYDSLKVDCPFFFQINQEARVQKPASDCDLTITYPDMDATIYLNYNKVDDNLRELLIDGQKLSYSHNQMADAITEQPFVKQPTNVYGMLYQVEGNAASNTQFYVTDSTNHFMTAALYFNREPNYDSIYPAVDYITADMVKIMESMQWKN